MEVSQVPSLKFTAVASKARTERSQLAPVKHVRTGLITSVPCCAISGSTANLRCWTSCTIQLHVAEVTIIAGKKDSYTWACLHVLLVNPHRPPLSSHASQLVRHKQHQPVHNLPKQQAANRNTCHHSNLCGVCAQSAMKPSPQSCHFQCSVQGHRSSANATVQRDHAQHTTCHPTSKMHVCVCCVHLTSV